MLTLLCICISHILGSADAKRDPLDALLRPRYNPTDQQLSTYQTLIIYPPQKTSQPLTYHKLPRLLCDTVTFTALPASQLRKDAALPHRVAYARETSPGTTCLLNIFPANPSLREVACAPLKAGVFLSYLVSIGLIKNSHGGPPWIYYLDRNVIPTNPISIHSQLLQHLEQALMVDTAEKVPAAPSHQPFGFVVTPSGHCDAEGELSASTFAFRASLASVSALVTALHCQGRSRRRGLSAQRCLSWALHQTHQLSPQSLTAICEAATREIAPTPDVLMTRNANVRPKSRDDRTRDDQVRGQKGPQRMAAHLCRSLPELLDEPDGALIVVSPKLLQSTACHQSSNRSFGARFPWGRDDLAASFTECGVGQMNLTAISPRGSPRLGTFGGLSDSLYGDGSEGAGKEDPFADLPSLLENEEE